MEPFQTQINEAAERALVPPRGRRRLQERPQPQPGARGLRGAFPWPGTCSQRCKGRGKAGKREGSRRARRYRGAGKARGERGRPRAARVLPASPKGHGISLRKGAKAARRKDSRSCERETARASLPSAERKGEVKIPEVGKSEREHGRCLEKHSPLQCQTSSQTP